MTIPTTVCDHHSMPADVDLSKLRWRATHCDHMRSWRLMMPEDEDDVAPVAVIAYQPDAMVYCARTWVVDCEWRTFSLFRGNLDDAMREIERVIGLDPGR